MIRATAYANIAAAIVFAAFLVFADATHAARGAADPADPSADGELVRWSPLVRDIQNLLIEFGLLSGPANGGLDSDTKRAIRAYQRINGRRVDGGVSAALRGHMERVGRPGSLKKRLAEARREQIEQTRRALMQSPATRDLLAARPPPAPANAKSELGRCLRAPVAECLLDEALFATNAITRDDYRDWALREVIRTQARAADLSHVRASIRRLSDIRLIPVSLREAVIGLVAAGRLGDAKTLAATIPDRWNRARALAAVVAAEETTASQNSSLPALLALLPRLKDKIAAAEIASGLAVKLAARGAMQAASRILETVLSISAEDTDTYPVTLGIIAGAHARIGQTETALKLLARIGELGRDHVALAEAAGQFAKRRLSRNALAIAERLRAPRLYVLALSKIASAQTSLGDHAAAKLTLVRAMTASHDIERPFAVDTAMAQIAAVWAKLPDYRRAFVTVAKIKSLTLRARTIWQFAASGNGDAAELGAKALSATQAIESPFDRAAVLTRAAVLMAKKQRLGEARRIFALALKDAGIVHTNWWRARIFSRLAAALLTFAL